MQEQGASLKKENHFIMLLRGHNRHMEKQLSDMREDMRDIRSDIKDLRQEINKYKGFVGGIVWAIGAVSLGMQLIITWLEK